MPHTAITRSMLAAAIAVVCLPITVTASATEWSQAPAPPVSAEGAENPEEAVLATSSLERAVRLGAEPTQIPLGSFGPGGLLQGLRAAGTAARIYLVLDDVQAEGPPGLGFEVLLDAPNGSGSVTGAERVGYIFLYDLKPTRRSFDVTDAVKAFLGRGLNDPLVVTIRPASETAAALNPQAEVKLREELEKAGVSLTGARLVAE